MTDEREFISTEQRLEQLPGLLLQWYPEVKRELPWRLDPSPYHVWISEIMLQQTRIEAVKGYYARFLEMFPTIADLAAADEQLVMKQWEGLGYYSRARNLRRAAIVCSEEYGGELPADHELLRSLPGIGSYTAGAIGSIAFHLPVPAVDGNVLRVMTRFLADGSDIAREKTKKEFERLLQSILPEECPGEFNQALMELGELVCIPGGKPLCERCPLCTACAVGNTGNWEAYPVKSAAKKRRIEEMTVLLVRCGARYAIRRRPDTGLLAGLYELPWLNGHWEESEIRDWLAERSMEGEVLPLPDESHVFSHVEWHMKGWELELPEPLWEEAWEYHTGDEIRREFPIPTAMKKYDQRIQ